MTGGTLVTGRDPEFSDDRQVIIETRWLPLSNLHDYDLYPPFLPAFIETGLRQGFDTLCPEYFDSML